MNTDVENIKADNFRLIAEPQQQAREEATKYAVDVTRNDMQFAAEEAEYEQGQQAQVEGAKMMGQGMTELVSSFEVGMEEEKNKQDFKAAIHDTENRKKFGGYSPAGIPKGHAAIKQGYGDSLHLQNVVSTFGAQLGTDKVAMIDSKTAQSKNMLIESYKQNLGFTQEEAEEKVNEVFNEAQLNNSKLRDLANIKEGLTGLKDMATGAFTPEAGVNIAKGIGGTFMGMLEKLSIVDAPITEGGMQYSNVINMSDEQFKENYPEMAEDLQKASIIEGKENPTPDEKKELNWLQKRLKVEASELNKQSIKDQKAITEAGKAFFNEAKRIITGGEYDETILNNFAANVTDDPAKQEWVKKVMPFVSVAPILGAELAAAKMARKAPEYFFKQTGIGKVVEALTVSNPGSYVGTIRGATEAVEASAESAARVKAATDGGSVGQHKEKIAKDLINEDYADPESAAAASHLVKKMKAADGESPAVRDTVAKVESDIKQAQANAPIDKNDSVPVVNLTPALDSIPGDDAAKALTARTVKTLNAQPHRNINEKGAPGLTKAETGQIIYNDELTLGRFLQASHGPSASGALDRLGYSPELLAKLVTNDEEAKLFTLFHEDGHVKAGDHLDGLYGLDKKTSRPQIQAQREEIAMLHALSQFSKATGKPFTDVINPNMTPASFAVFNPEMNTFQLRAVPAQDAAGLPAAPPHIQAFFDVMNKNGSDFRKASSAIEQEVKANITLEGQSDPTKAMPVMRGEVFDVNTQTMRQGIIVQDFIEMGEVFGIPRKELETLNEYSDRVYNAFANRYSATEQQLAQGTARHPDMTPELGKPYGEAQLAKMEEIINTWRGLKQMSMNTLGTNQQDNAMNLALWYRSQVANNGTSYRMVHSATQTMNRAAKGVENGTSWAEKPRRVSEYSTERIGKGFGETPGRRSVLREAGEDISPKSMTDEELSKSQGQVFAEGDTKSEVGSKPAKLHGADEAAAKEARDDDAMANITQITEGKTIDELNAIERDRLAMKADDTPSGPVSATTHSLAGTSEDLRVLELEEFAGTGATDAFMFQGKINVFHANGADIQSNLGAVLEREGGTEMFDTIYKGFVDNQIGEMARRITENGADEHQMLLFHRAMGVAQAMQDMKRGGNISAATDSWLKEMDLRPGAEGITNEEAILNGLDSASSTYGFAFNMQKDYQNVIDTRMAEIYDGLPHRNARELFVETYGKTMSGPDAIKMRQELNAARKQLIEIVGGPCV